MTALDRNRKHLAVLIAFFILAAIFHLSTLRLGHRWGGDFAMYLHHAKNLAEGNAYGDTGYRYNLEYPVLGPRMYPPGYPVVAAPVFHFFGLDIQAFKIEIVALLLGFFLAVYYSFRRLIPFGWMLALLSLMCFSPSFWDFSDHVGSDALFAFLIYPALALVDRYQQKEARLPWTQALLFGFLAYLLFATRTAGIIVIPAALVAEFWQRRRIRVQFLCATVFTLVLVSLQGMLLQRDSSYLDQLDFSVAGLIGNAKGYMMSVYYFWGSGPQPWPGRLVFALFSLMSLIGFSRQMRSKIRVWEVFLGGYLLLILLWPDIQGLRFLIPVMPLYLLYGIQGILSVVKYDRARRLALIALFLVVGFCFFAEFKTRDFVRINDGPWDPAAQSMFEWVKENTAPDDTFCFRKPRVLSLFTDRPAGVLHDSVVEGSLWNFVDEIGAKYIIRTPKDISSHTLFYERNADRLKVVFKNVDFEILEVLNK